MFIHICKEQKVSNTVYTTILLTWRFGLLGAASSFSMQDVTVPSVVETGSNPYIKYTIKIILLYSLVRKQKYEFEWQNCSRLFSKQGYVPHE